MSDLPAELPLTSDFDLSRLSDAGADVVLAPDEATRAEMARWLEVVSIDAFVAKVELTRESHNNFLYEATIEADVTQACSVTLEPLKAHISRSFTRELHLVRATRHSPAVTEELAVDTGDDDVPEEITSSHYDVAGPVLEEFSLAIDPYPRAPGAAFESPAEPSGEAENPFAVLKRLKTGV